jgi:hypothetical protein
MRPTEALIQQFNANDLPFYVMVDSKNFVVSSNIKSKDIGKGSEKLLSFVKTLPATSAANYKVYCFEELPEIKGVDAKSLAQCLHLADCVLSFCPFFETDERREEKEANRYYYNQRQAELDNKMDLIMAMLKAREEAETDEELEEQAEPVNGLAGLINNPKIQDMLIGMISGMATKFMTGGQAPQAMAGIPATAEDNEAVLVDAIQRLYAVDPDLHNDLSKLADLAEKDAGQFNFLLGLLRK